MSADPTGPAGPKGDATAGGAAAAAADHADAGADVVRGRRCVSVRRVIAAPAAAIFAVLSSPAGHAAIDGSSTVVEPRPGGPERLVLGSRFGMSMKLGIPYRIRNEVVEYEEDRRIAWQHFGKHRWRYELEPVEGGTLVTETFDWSTSWFPKGIELAGYPRSHVPNMVRTLERLAAVVGGA